LEKPLLHLHAAIDVDSFWQAVQDIIGAALQTRLIGLTLQRSPISPRIARSTAKLPGSFFPIAPVEKYFNTHLRRNVVFISDLFSDERHFRDLRFTAKPIAEVDDKTLILADQAEKAIAQMRQEVTELMGDKYAWEKAEEIAKLMTSGTWTHDYQITCERARALGLLVNTDIRAASVSGEAARSAGTMILESPLRRDRNSQQGRCFLDGVGVPIPQQRGNQEKFAAPDMNIGAAQRAGQAARDCEQSARSDLAL
jgi:hypothetical protein